MIHFGSEADFGGNGGVVCWKEESEFKDAACIGTWRLGIVLEVWEKTEAGADGGSGAGRWGIVPLWMNRTPCHTIVSEEKREMGRKETGWRRYNSRHLEKEWYVSPKDNVLHSLTRHYHQHSLRHWEEYYSERICCVRVKVWIYVDWGACADPRGVGGRDCNDGSDRRRCLSEEDAEEKVLERASLLPGVRGWVTAVSQENGGSTHCWWCLRPVDRLTTGVWVGEIVMTRGNEMQCQPPSDQVKKPKKSRQPHPPTDVKMIYRWILRRLAGWCLDSITIVHPHYQHCESIVPNEDFSIEHSFMRELQPYN